MMLPRKRQRPNPADSSSSSVIDAPSDPIDKSAAPPGPAASATSLPAAQSLGERMPPKTVHNKDSDKDLTLQGPVKQVRKSQSWYGSWPRTPKATASTSVARDNIFGDSIRSKKGSDLTRFDTKKDSDSSSPHSTTRTVPELSKIPEDGMTGNEDGPDGKGVPDDGKNQINEMAEPSATATEENKAPEQSELSQTTPQRPATSSGWLGWWSKTPFTEVQTSLPPPEPADDGAKTDGITRPSTPPAQTANPDIPADEQPSNPPAYTSWFGLWSAKSADGSSSDATDNKTSHPEPAIPTSEDVVMEDAPPPANLEANPQPAPKAGSTWAFWSRDSPKAQGMTKESEPGEIAVIGEGSETQPTPMTEDDVSGTPSKPPKVAKDTASTKSSWRRSNKRLRPPSMDIDNQSPSPSGTSTPQESTTKVDSSNKSIAESVAPTKPNLLLPSFISTYQMKENTSIVKQIAQLLLRTQQAAANHVFRVKDAPKIRKAIAIGVHGLFPATYLRPMIGQPTGTSLRFASLCADAIRKWTDEHGCSDCEIEKVALEGEGKINERVDNLWKLMLNWIEHIRSADLILIASHSQGVPVSIMLLEKLIDLGIITNAKIGVCAMAGVGLGPFPEYKSSIFMGSAAELWEFGKPESQNSQRFEAALKRVLEYGARITFIGSIDDQVVPLESALYSPAHHPYIYRAVFIDGRVHASDFIAHLVGFALKLRNLGVSDHGLIRELSLPLAGSLYSGEGHSRLYFDSAVYDLAVSHALETTPAPHHTPPCVIHRQQSSTGVGSGGVNNQTNPYVLPWIMRGILEEDLVKTELSSESEELLRQFDDWKPNTKALKDVKYRLEAVRSKL